MKGNRKRWRGGERRIGCLCSHVMLEARVCFQNNGGICLFCFQKKKKEKERQMREEHYR